MKIFRSRYGFSTSAHSRDREGNEIKHYVDVGFLKGEEPEGDIEGNLVLKTPDGERACFLSCYRKGDGSVATKLVVLGNGEKPREVKFEQTTLDGERDVTAAGNKWSVQVEPNDLPFY